ncbi:hypothetical protein [Actinoplanes solisilvae]|uniref:hypothetical protein n=1 Tax=Actinoplanes solisilvae TaxID=2486853 RepID=UPI000FD9D560|nr:hypothetical protein [Actinoplanes solisilvae]
MSGLIAQLAAVGLAGPLAVAGYRKLTTPTAELPWPIERGPLATPYGPRITAIAELLAVVGAILLPGVWAAAPIALMYAGLTGVAVALRGRRCACFGARQTKAIGALHIAANAAAATVAVVALLLPGSAAGLPARGGAVVLGLAISLTVLLLLERRRPAAEAPCTEPVFAVALYVSDHCPSCRSLKQLVSTMDAARRDAVEMTVLQPGDDLPSAAAGLGVPCAVGLGADGQPVCPAVDGIGKVKALIDRVVIRAESSAHAG